VDPVVYVDFTGKSVVVGGANVGLGFEASKQLRLDESKEVGSRIP
jgi:hypothetical protein